VITDTLTWAERVDTDPSLKAFVDAEIARARVVDAARGMCAATAIDRGTRRQAHRRPAGAASVEGEVVRHRVRVLQPTEDRAARDAELEFCRVMGHDRHKKRKREIAALPKVPWRGKTLYTLRCQGDFGRGPHDMNVPRSLLWHLIDLGRYLCAFHR
jgi:hypothetical protein